MTNENNLVVKELIKAPFTSNIGNAFYEVTRSALKTCDGTGSRASLVHRNGVLGFVQQAILWLLEHGEEPRKNSDAFANEYKNEWRQCTENIGKDLRAKQLKD